MNLAPSAVGLLLLQWTLLLVLGWVCHSWLRDGHPRWRLILWRSILCFGAALPLLGLLRVPRLNLPLPRAVVPLEAAVPVPAEAEAKVGASAAVRPTEVRASRATVATTSSSSLVPPAMSSASRTPATEPPAARILWWLVLALAWLAGFAWESWRLWRQQLELRRLARRSMAANGSVQELAREIQCELGVARAVQVRVVEEIESPFLCGVLKPTILIPRRLAEELPVGEISALLSHELAHQCRRDLAWCIGWRLMKALYWFHPLMWWVPDAHVMACEEEADRIAARRVYAGAGYAQLLAQLTLRVLRGPAVESGMALHATSHFSRRLAQLGRERAMAWRWVHSVTGLALAAGLLVLTAGWQFGQEPAATAVAVNVPTGTVVVTVQDEQGQPLEGVTITPDGMRGKGEGLRGSHYGWRPSVHGAVVKAVTDRDGKASVTYPLMIMPAEKIETGEISFSVYHPDYAPERPTTFRVDGTGEPVRLKRGIPIRVAAYFGPNREPVTDFVPNLLGDRLYPKLQDWQRGADGSLSWGRMSPGKHYLHVSGRRTSGEIVYSDGIAFFGEQREAHYYIVELKPGVRVEGRLDAKVPRPVKNGWVQLSVHDDESNLRDGMQLRIMPGSGNTGVWFSYRPIAADGTFVFESVPRGELKLIAYGEGFISVNGMEEEQPRPFPGRPLEPPRRTTRGVPQSFRAMQPVTVLEVPTEPTATLRVVAKADGRAVSGAKIHVWPNVTQMPAGSRIYGGVVVSSEDPFRKMTPLPEPTYSVLTDESGVAVLRNIPAFNPYFGVEHARFEVPLQSEKESNVPARFRGPPNRYVSLNLVAGETAQVEVALQPKGREFAGDNR